MLDWKCRIKFPKLKSIFAFAELQEQVFQFVLVLKMNAKKLNIEVCMKYEGGQNNVHNIVINIALTGTSSSTLIFADQILADEICLDS